ncbi:uncharacterized protein LOC143885884 [Tasmannia lanceolata]|uniref:uncharacterized protein LOC143885884 n=1 Tax=Tasmannia lanceolata TaxID=3420 RepID=UPI004063C648
MRFSKEFFEELKLDRGTSDTFIALIPKVKGASSIGDFRPISLLGCLYKLLAKVLAARIKLVMPKIISNSQSAFVSHRRQMLRACGLIEGFRIGAGESEITHLQFADDTLLFSSPNVERILNLKAIIRCYELISRQRSNFHKSKFYGIHLDEEVSLGLAGIMDCKLDRFPSIYLGLPLGVGKHGKASWNPIVERVERRLATWKRNLVSRGGRLTLIKAVLANIPIYQLSLFKCPISILLKIEQI